MPSLSVMLNRFAALSFCGLNFGHSSSQDPRRQSVISDFRTLLVSDLPLLNDIPGPGAALA